MAHTNTVLSQILKLVPRHEFETLANQHHSGRQFRKASRWSQFVTMLTMELSARLSLRDIVATMSAQSHRLYHIGSAVLSKTTLGRINQDKPYTLYEALFGKLLSRCSSLSPKHSFRFNNKLMSLDSTTIDLCLELYPWAEFRQTKAAIKLHVGLDHSGHLPSVMTVTDGKTTDIEVARSLNFSKGSIVICDRGYTDYGWYNTLSNKGVFFVSRLKSNAKYRVTQRRSVNKHKGLRSDQTIEFTGAQTAKRCPVPLRRVSYRDLETGKQYVFITNHFELSAKTIADIYKQRWQIELFFKWIKQNLKIKSFIGTSKNAVLTQVWIAMCAYLILCYIKFVSKIRASMQEILRLLQVNLFEKRDMVLLLKGSPPNIPENNHRQTVLF